MCKEDEMSAVSSAEVLGELKSWMCKSVLVSVNSYLASVWEPVVYCFRADLLISKLLT